MFFKHLCIFGPKGTIQIRYYYYYYYALAIITGNLCHIE